MDYPPLIKNLNSITALSSGDIRGNKKRG